VIRDDPIIRSLEATGLPPWDDGKTPRCPVCGEECGEIYIGASGDVCGCDRCMTTRDAWEWMEEQG